jgi:hypothetical protein
MNDDLEREWMEAVVACGIPLQRLRKARIFLRPAEIWRVYLLYLALKHYPGTSLLDRKSCVTYDSFLHIIPQVLHRVEF